MKKTWSRSTYLRSERLLLSYPFPLKETNFLTWKMLEAQAGLKIAADLVSRATIPRKPVKLSVVYREIFRKFQSQERIRGRIDRIRHHGSNGRQQP